MSATTYDFIPEHLHPYIATQDWSRYIAIDHACWRFIMKLNVEYLSRQGNAHPFYEEALRETGITTDHVPDIREMDEKLSRYGWRAVPISGFIPPAVFIELQSLGVLPIAVDMRKLENIAYTPAPDITHEAAGHAPFLAHPEFSKFVRQYGAVAPKAIFSRQDIDVYDAIRDLSDTKERPDATAEEIKECEKALDEAMAAMTDASEALKLSRLFWWTSEYGLVGDLDNPKIYGAGLLSSVGEGKHALSGKVKKLPFSLEAAETNFDITEMQPQLFVIEDFEALNETLKEFIEGMAFKRGGLSALQEAKEADYYTTTVLDSGLQISSIVDEVLIDDNGDPFYVRYKGGTQLAYWDRQLDGHGTDYHAHGYSTPLGKLKGKGKSPCMLSESDLAELGFYNHKKGKMEFESGVTVEGRLKGFVERDGRRLILTFEDCTVKLGKRKLFEPGWGMFDMACGGKVKSVYGGPADKLNFQRLSNGFKQRSIEQKTNLTTANRELNALYSRVRDIREAGDEFKATITALTGVKEVLDRDHPRDWLLRYELLEFKHDAGLQLPWADEMRAKLESLKDEVTEAEAELIDRGLAIFDKG